MKVDPRISTGNCNGPIHEWFNLTYAGFLILPRVMLQEMPTKWQARFVALLKEAEGMGVVVPGFCASRKGDNGKYRALGRHWCNYRHGSLREAMAIEEAEGAEGE